MKLWNRKQKSFIAAAAAGMLLLATSAYADITGRTGYEKLKETIRSTIMDTAYGYESYTTKVDMQVMDNGMLVHQMQNVNRIDRKAGASENAVTVSNTKGIVEQNYTFNSRELNIWYDRYQDVYMVTRMTPDSYRDPLPGEARSGLDSSPVTDETGRFEEGARDVERIIDAMVGNLKDHIQFAEKADGSTTLTGSLGGMQIPPLVNAIVSYMYKQAQPGKSPVETVAPVDGKGSVAPVEQNRLEYPVLVNDLYVSMIEGTAQVDPKGILTELAASGTISGQDRNGTSHELEVEIRMTFTGINATQLTPPDLTGKNVREYTDAPRETFAITPRYTGTYVQDITELREDRFVKTGERILVITRAEAGGISGRFSERYFQGDRPEWSFLVEGTKTYDLAAEFTYADRDGITRNGTVQFDAGSPELTLLLATGDPDTTSAWPEKSKPAEIMVRFRRVFD